MPLEAFLRRILFYTLGTAEPIGYSPAELVVYGNELVRAAWRYTQTPIPHMKLALAGDDFRADPEVRDSLTWLWGENPFFEANLLFDTKNVDKSLHSLTTICIHT